VHKKLTLLHVIASMDPKTGGTGEAIRNAYTALVEYGVYSEVVSLDSPSAPFLSEEVFPIYALGPSKAPWHSSKKLVPWLTENANNYDVIIVNGLWLYPGYAVRKAIEKIRGKKDGVKQLKRPKVFVMPHGMLDPYFQSADSRKLKAIRNLLYWKLVERKNVEEAAALLFTCEEELLLARTSFRPYKPTREINVGMGITAPPVYSETMRVSFEKRCPKINGSKYFLFLSRINDKKGVDLLVEAYINTYHSSPTAEDNNTQDRPYLVIAGPGMETPYGKKILALAAKSPAADFILFPGMLSGDVKWGAFYNCEAFILPSHQENFGIAIVEAIACGRPVIISDKVNIWREIQSLGAGIIGGDNNKATIESLKKWQSLSPAEKTEMGMEARLCYEKKFTVEVAAEKLAKTLRTAVESEMIIQE
jgi:glycosyltransferase involved in cell wall biosynthesis